MKVCLVEDYSYKYLYPLTKTRPTFGLRCGKFTIEERILKFFPGDIDQVNYLVRPEMEQVWKMRNQADTEISFNNPKEGPRLILNGSILFDEQSLRNIFSKLESKSPAIWLSEDTWAAIFLPENIPALEISELLEGDFDLSIFANQRYLDIPVISYPWDIIKYNSTMARSDFTTLKGRLTRLRYPPLPEKVVVMGSDNLMVGQNTEIYPFVTLDCTRGPIIIGDNVTIESGAFIQGPAIIDDNCLVSANSKVYRGTTLGDTCKIGGEISHSIIHGFSNKRHSGFLGNAYICEWVNMGAGTNNSNMKNNYNKISVSWNGEQIGTGSQFIGLFMGDHSRSAINTQFNTATFVGVGCNIFGNGVPPEKIKDFTWGGIEQFDTYDFQKFVENAKRMMIRRENELSKEERNLLKALHERRSIMTERKKVKSTGSL